MKIFEVTARRHVHIDEAGTAMYYMGYPCTKDCSGHQAGYRYAEYYQIDDGDDCPYGNSNSFWEGCKSYSENK